MKFILFLSFFSLSSWAIGPEEILKNADEVRNPSESYFTKIRVKSSNEPEDYKFDVFLKGNNKTLIKSLAPKKIIGRNMLMIDENMWVYVPNLKRAVRVSLSQKLVGEASNGDISRMRWFGDYSAKIEKEDAKQYVLYLEQLKKGLTYPKLRVFIEKKTFNPIKAEFLTLSDKVLKHSEYLDYKEMAGKKRPSRIKITDAMKVDNYSEIMIDAVEVRKLPDSMFTEKSIE